MLGAAFMLSAASLPALLVLYVDMGAVFEFAIMPPVVLVLYMLEELLLPLYIPEPLVLYMPDELVSVPMLLELLVLLEQPASAATAATANRVVMVFINIFFLMVVLRHEARLIPFKLPVCQLEKGGISLVPAAFRGRMEKAGTFCMRKLF
jgi:hypothetical protein